MIHGPVRIVIVSGATVSETLPASIQRKGTLLPLIALPIYAARPLEVQALTGMGPGGVGVFDDWRPEAYRITPVSDSLPPHAMSVLDEAREAGIAVVDGTPGPGGLPDGWILQVTDGLALDGLTTPLIGSGTTVWLAACTALPVERVLNPNALLVSLGVMEIDGAGHPDWSRSLAYHVGHGQLWVNLRGREPQGIVQPGAEYDEVRRTLQALIAERLVDPATEKPAVEVFLKEDLYAGTWLWAAPDLVLVPGERYGFSPAALVGQPEASAVRSEAGVTYRPGWWGATGPGVRPDRAPPALGILSVAPTMAAILGLPLSHWASGKVLMNVFTDEFWASRPVGLSADRSALSADEERLLAERLRELGYIE